MKRNHSDNPMISLPGGFIKPLPVTVALLSLSLTSFAPLSSFASERILHDTPDSRAAVEKRMESLTLPELRNIISADTLDADRWEALLWLYAYMPLSDISDYAPSYHLANINSAFRAREEMPWGKDIPEREFRYFVLPARVNNEALDGCRPIFYEELKERVKDLPMKDAILEVNHWCHEKVSYKPSDGRTSPPLSTLSQAIGRCGEESTFTVAALRSVGIPARQVYTPRWAHTDDNHAWVEAWADGKWYFLGACEPEAVLNLAWFNAPASRGMLMTTNVTGRYDGLEEVISTTDITTTINVTSNYAPVGESVVRVLHPDGSPAEGVDVDFCLYNYASFYPLARRKSDSKGEASLLTGMGDAVVWAFDGKKYGFTTLSPKDGVKDLILDVSPDSLYSREFLIVPPAQGATAVEVPPALALLNNQRLQYEDSVRNAYIASFGNPEMRGNSKKLTTWLERRKNAGMEKEAHRLLATLAEKDLRDVSTEVLDDALDNTPGVDFNDDFSCRYILSPRIRLEHLRPWRRELRDSLGSEGMANLRANPASVADLILRRLTLFEKKGPKASPVSPAAVWRVRGADEESRDILAIALLRASGVPARINSITGKAEWADDSRNWHLLIFDSTDLADSPGLADSDRSAKSSECDGLSSKLSAKGTTVTPQFRYISNGIIPNPKYYSHFTIAPFSGELPEPLEFDEFIDIDSLNRADMKLDTGIYSIVSGERLADGSVRGIISFVNLTPENQNVDITVPANPEDISVIGSFDSESLFTTLEGKPSSILSATGRGFYLLAAIQPGHEPTQHLLNELAELKEEFETAGVPIVILLPDLKSLESLPQGQRPILPQGQPSDLQQGQLSDLPQGQPSDLPANIIWGIDPEGDIAKKIAAGVEYDSIQLPLVIVADTFNRVVSASRGYTIGTGNRLLSLLRRL